MEKKTLPVVEVTDAVAMGCCGGFFAAVSAILVLVPRAGAASEADTAPVSAGLAARIRAGVQ